MSDSALLKAIGNLSPRQLRIVLPAVPKTTKAMNDLPGDGPGPDTVTPEDAPAVMRRIWARQNLVGIKQLELRELRMLAETLWVSPNPFLADMNTFSAVEVELRSRKTRRIVYALLTSYIAAFDEANPYIAAIGRFLAQEANQYGFSWLKAATELNLFEPRLAGRTIADRVLESSENPQAYLRERGFLTLQAGQGLPKAVFSAAVQKVDATHLDRETLTLKLLEWAETPDGDECFPDLAELLANALLSPWPQTPPPPPLGPQIIKFLLKHYKDPRMHPANWDARIDHSRPPDKKLQSIFRRWQTERSIQRFLSIVGRYANQDQWQYRKAFWMSYLRRGHISDAWVVLGQNPRSGIRPEDLAEVGLLGPGRSPDHSVLIMKIGDLTIADWSHNAKCHTWRSNDRNAPKLFLKNYSVSALSSGTWSEAHTASEHGNWQKKFAEHIRRHTGIRLAEKDWMPNGR